jgi:ankyrin repeat protein
VNRELYFIALTPRAVERNVEEEMQMGALMDAVNHNAIDEVRTLIRQGVDVNQLDAQQNAPLVIAAYKGYAEIVRMLLEAGADVAAVDPGMKATALHAASYAGRTEAAKLLIAHKIDIDAQGPYNGYTALHDAIWQNRIDTAKVLIDAGANLNVKSNDGQTPLELASAKRRKEIIALIREKTGS